jgi:uncharacterized protein YndB with AHSA1/START domain
MSYQLKVEKLIAKPASDVFNALKGGLLFMNCGSDSATMKIDFKVGGKYRIEFHNHTKWNGGEFLEIIPDKKIVFTWRQEFTPEGKPDTTVAIELFPDGPKTRLVLMHSGFKDKELCDAHQFGWTCGITDMSEELQNGRLRFLRKFKAPIEKLYETCRNPETFFAHMGNISRGTVDFKVGGKYQVPNDHNGIEGEFLEIVPNKKIILSWLKGCSGPLKESKVTLTFNQKEDGSSSLELIHDGLPTTKEQFAHRQGWEYVAEKLIEKLGA